MVHLHASIKAYQTILICWSSNYHNDNAVSEEICTCEVAVLENQRNVCIGVGLFPASYKKSRNTSFFC
jgi:hypothetical protein